MMKKGCPDIDVYEAAQERFHFLFREFENIYISFRGGKDSKAKHRDLQPEYIR